MNKPDESPGFPYFHFVTGFFYGFIAGLCLMAYLTWKYILRPQRDTTGHNRARAKPKAAVPRQGRHETKNVLVQGPVTYNRPPHYKSKDYEDLAKKNWGAWHY